jgi:hypothetical protein
MGKKRYLLLNAQADLHTCTVYAEDRSISRLIMKEASWFAVYGSIALKVISRWTI